MKRSKVYDREFKENTVKLSNERNNLTQFTREFDISVKQLYSLKSYRYTIRLYI